MACTFSIPERLTKVGIVSGAALFTDSELVENVNEGTRKFLTMPREKPLLSRLFVWMMLGRWVREAAAAYAHKQAERSKNQAA